VKRAQLEVWKVGDKAVLHLSDDGSLLVADQAIGHHTYKIEVWDVRAYRVRGSVYVKDASAVDVAALSSDGARLVLRRRDFSAALPGLCEIWDTHLAPFRCLGSWKFRYDETVVDAARVGANWKFLLPDAVETRDDAGELISRIALQVAPKFAHCTRGALSRDGKVAVFAPYARVFDAGTGNFKRELWNTEWEMSQVSLSPSGRFCWSQTSYLFSEGQGSTSGLWNTQSGTEIRSNRFSSAPIFSPDETAALDDKGRFINISDGKPSRFQIAWPRVKSLDFACAQLSRDGAVWAVPDAQGKVWIREGAAKTASP
jgi:hypothetical protein